MIRLICLCFTLFTFQNSFAQSDELEELFRKSFHQRTSIDSGVYYANQALRLSQELRYKSGEQISKMYAGMAYYNGQEVDTATTLLYNSLPYLEERPLELGLAHWYIGKIHVRTNNFDGGSTHYHQAIEAFSQTDSTIFLGDVYTSLGIIEGMQSKYNEALDWFTKAYELKIELGEELETASELNNIGIVYMRLGSYEKAKELYWKSINLRDDDNDATNYDNLGGVYNLSQNLDSAIYYYTKSYDLSVEHEDNRGIIISSINLSNILYQKSEHKDAIQLLKKGLKLTEQDPGSWSGLITELGKNYRKLEQTDSAIYYLRLGYKMSKKSKSLNWSKESST